MFERFTESARNVVILAQEESRILRHDHIGTEHLLLGILRTPGAPVAVVLADHGVTVEATRARVVEILGQGHKQRPGQLPFTPRAKNVLELSLRESLARGHEIVAPLHIALALAREGGGLGARVLGQYGVDFDTLDRQWRLARARARLQAWERRAELVELAAGAPSASDAVRLVAERFELSEDLARDILSMEIWSFTANNIERLREALEELEELAD